MNAPATGITGGSSTLYRCRFGHLSVMYLILARDEENRITVFGGSAWNQCNACKDSPNLVEKMQAALNIYRQWLAEKVINQSEYHGLANSAATRDTPRPRSAAQEIIHRFYELTSEIEVRTHRDHTMRKAERRDRLMELKQDLAKVKTDFQQWAIQEGFMDDATQTGTAVAGAKKPGKTEDARANTDDASEIEGIIESLRLSGLTSISERIAYLHREISKDPEEPPVSVDSLSGFAGFVSEIRLPGPPPIIWINPSGHVGLQWSIPAPDGPEVEVEAEVKVEAEEVERLPRSETALTDDNPARGKGDGILAIVFLPSGLIRFSGTSGPVRSKSLTWWLTKGILPQATAISTIRPFLEHLESHS